MGETTAQVTLDGYVDPTLGQLASQAYVQAQIAEAVAGSAYIQTQLPAGTQGQVFGPTGVAGVPALINPGALNITPANGTTARSLSALFGDSLNLKNLGALLNGTPGDQTTIDGIYASLANGSVVNVPTGGSWSGTLTSPNPSKNITWLLGGSWPNPYNEFIGDGDLSVGYANASAEFWKVYVNNTSFFPPISATLWNQDPHFLGPYTGNFIQYAAINANYTTGPTSTGNTSGVSVVGTSYGYNNSASYEVLFDANINKYGNNSLWGYVSELNDFSGRVPQAFSLWQQELDGVSNGHDVSPMDANGLYYTPAIGNRTGVYVSMGTLPQPAWSANATVSAASTGQTSSTPASTIQATVNSVIYVYVCSTGGTTGSSAPTFHQPAVFSGSIASNGVMTVTALQAGSPAIAVNQIVTGYNLVPPRGTVVRITSQLTGTAGGVGTYQTTYLNAVGLTGLYACLQTTDNTAVWDFGTEYFAQYHSAFWVAANKTGGVAGNVGTAYGVNTSIYNAAFDCSLCTFTSNAAAVRIGPNQFIDFSAQGTSTTQNLRVLYYSTYAGANTLVYGNPAGNCMEILDNGAFKTLKNTLDDGNGNITPAGAVGTTFAGVTATGTTGATAAATTTQYIWVNGGSGGIKLPATLGVIVTVYNALSTSLVVYSNDGTQTRETLTAGSRARYYTAANNNALLA